MEVIDKRIDSLKEEIINIKKQYDSALEAMNKAGDELKNNTDMSPLTIARLSAQYAKASNRVVDLQSRTSEYTAQLESAIKEKEDDEQGKNSIINVEQLCRNIRFRLKSEGVKIGQIEADAGVQPGYLSRFEKNPGKSIPTLEFVATAAKDLNVSIDFLIHGNCDSLTATEDYVLKFIRRLETDTFSEKMQWKVDLMSYMDASLSENGPSFPFTEEIADFEFEYNFLIPLDGYYTPINDGYHCFLPNSTNLVYLMQLQRNYGTDGKTIEPGYALYLVEETFNKYGVTQWKPSLVCSSFNTNKQIYDVLDNFYTEIQETLSHVQIDDHTRNAIDAFMNGNTEGNSIDSTVDESIDYKTPNDEDDDLPF